jgi:phosphotransferase system IIA component
VIGGDTVTLTQSGSFASKNAGTGIAVSVTDSLGGASAGDYTLIEPTGVTGTITPATLTVSGTTAGSKVYNGNTIAALTSGSLVGLIGGDTVTLTQAGSFASKNVGTGIAVTAATAWAGQASAITSWSNRLDLTRTSLRQPSR